jgi:guanine deaminase
MNHAEFMREAIRLSQENMRSGKGGPFGCVIVKDGQIIGRGWNQVTSSHDPTAHAEVTAIRDACKNLGSFQLDGCTVYTSCEPCPMCMGALYWARPEKIYFGNTKKDAADIGFDDSFIYEELALSMPERKLAMQPLLREEALAAFREWAEKQDKIEY